MAHPAQIVLWIFATVAAWSLLRAQLWRAWLFVRPGSMRIVEAATPPPLTPALLEKTKMLEALGFKPIGAHLEVPRLGPRRLYFDFVLDAPRVFATLAEHRRGRVSLYFLTPSADGPVLTADHFRLVGPGEALHVAGIPGWPPHRLLRAHRQRASRVTPTGEPTLAARLAAAREWYSGLAMRELRRVHLSGLLWTIGTIAMVAWAVLR